MLREDSTLARQASFIGNPAFEKDNFEAAVYVEDRWAPSDRMLIEPGVRFEGDEITRHPVLSPRLASSYMLTRGGQTKLTWGGGVDLDTLTPRVTQPPRPGLRP